MQGDGTKVVVPKLPRCDFCKDPAHFDAKTRMGPWASMCLVHFQIYGIELGVGKGQELVLEVCSCSDCLEKDDCQEGKVDA